ncbi:MAG: transglycosylase domain-containing protein [Polyangiaceae bacterium]|nr:transglycosylase domain-containing protein [Myxococcales bacterium]MCB9585833.1 transglycosylase domain-containing protein [Polyangiaceae bacterium]MCB9607238.1 transglycosylase domain-containing protein [Polyangiaceae bacterium]
MRRRAKVALFGVPSLLVFAALVGFGPVVRHQAKSAAEKRGLQLEIGSVRPGWGRIWLRDVSVSSVVAPGIQAKVASLEVVPSGLHPKVIRIHGGFVQLRGTTAELRDQLRLLQGGRSGTGGGGSTQISAEGIDLSWLAGEGARVDAWGIRYARSPEVESFHVDRLQSDRGFPLVGTGLAVELGREDGARVLRNVSSEALDARLDLDRSTRTRVVSDAAPSSRGEGWRKRIALAGISVSRVVPVGAKVDLAGLSVTLMRGGQPLRIGPGTLRVERTDSEISAELTPGDSKQQNPLNARVVLPLDATKDVKLSLHGGPVSLAWLGVREGEWGLSDVGHSKLSANADLLLKDQGRLLDFKGKVAVSDLTIEHRWLAPRRVEGLAAGFDGRGELALDGHFVRFVESDVSFGQVHATVTAELNRGEDGFQLKARGSVPLASCQTLLDSSPKGLTPLLTGMRASGTFAGDASIDLDSQHAERMKLKWNVANECRITATPADVAPLRFKQPFTLNVVGADGATVPFQTGPGSVNWTPRASISRHMETAVLICEDGRFFRHRGFDEEAIHNSIRENIKQRRFVRGASTISMQLAKNLYLKREKTLSRKLQEAVLTMLLEQEFSKQQLMELYLNVIEYAPGVYGIGPAARYYFNTHPSQLSLGQALYIGSILSNPKQQHFGASGEVGPGWSGYLRKLMKLGNRIRLVSDAELEDGLREQVTFKVPYSPRLPAEGEDPDAAHEADLANTGGNPAGTEDTPVFP